MSKSTLIEQGKSLGESRTEDPQDENLQAFLKLLPELLKEHRGQHALFVRGRFIGAGPLDRMIRLARSKYPGSNFLVQPVQEELPQVRLGALDLKRSSQVAVGA